MIISDRARAMMKARAMRHRIASCFLFTVSMQDSPFCLDEAVVAQPPCPFSVESVPALPVRTWYFAPRFAHVGAIIVWDANNAVLIKE